jgi:TRAP-type C4-dicarboxylate transport system permease small subunit
MRTFITRLSNYMSVVAGIILMVMAVLTFVDVVMRYMGKPVPGAYEVIAYLGVAVTGFALPRASLMKTHVYVDLVYDKMTGKPKMIMKTFTRILVAAFFLCTAVYFVRMGLSFIAARAVTMTLRVPFHPVVFGMAFCCLVQSMVTIWEIFEKEGGGPNE